MDKNTPSNHKKENPIVNLGVNIVIPSIVMSKFDDWFLLPNAVALILALVFPLSYGFFDLIKARKWNLFSIIGFFNILLTGGIGLLELPSDWIAIKEASVPAIFCIAVVLSMFNKHTLLEKFLLDENLLNAELIYDHIKTDEKKSKFRYIMLNATLILALSFVLSTILNFVLAKVVIHSETGTSEFTKELGHMLALSYPFIVLPCTIILYYMLRYIVKNLEKLTGLTVNEILDLK